MNEGTVDESEVSGNFVKEETQSDVLGQQIEQAMYDVTFLCKILLVNLRPSHTHLGLFQRKAAVHCTWKGIGLQRARLASFNSQN